MHEHKDEKGKFRYKISYENPYIIDCTKIKYVSLHIKFRAIHILLPYC